MSGTEFQFAWLSDARLAAHALSPMPVWLWSADATRILWANPAGVAVFGASAPAVAALRFDAHHAAAAEVARLAATLHGAAPRLERLRGFGAGWSRLLCACSRVSIEDRAPAILIVAKERIGQPLPLAECVRRLYEDCAEPIAVFSSHGVLIFATPTARSLGASTTLAALRASALGAEAMETGKSSGVTTIGPAELQRLGTGPTAVIAVSFPALQGGLDERPMAPAEATAPVETKADVAPPEGMPAELVAQAAPSLLHANAAPAHRHPLRFVWQMDGAHCFSLDSDEFIEIVGPATAAALGRSWDEINHALALDPAGRIARAVATHDTWSGITVSWPADGSSERLEVELSGVPIYDQQHKFAGYRGLGVCRDLDRLVSLLRLRRATPVSGPRPQLPAAEPIADEAGEPQASYADARAAAVAMTARNVVPFRAAQPESAPALSPVERKAFHELARQLSARLKHEAEPSEAMTAEPDQPASDVSSTAPEDPVGNVAAVPASQFDARVLLDGGVDGILILDPAGVIAWANRAAGVLFGYEASDLVGLPFAELFAPEGRRAIRDDLASLSSGPTALSSTGREVAGLIRGTGLAPRSVSLWPIAESGAGFAAIVRDMTAWQNAERGLRGATQRAEEARDRAQASSVAKSELLARISHELRTSLNSVVGFSETMIEERFGPIGNERYRKYLADIRRSGEQMVALLNDMLDLSKIETGKAALGFEHVHLNEVLQTCITELQIQANRGRVLIRTSLLASLPPVIADPKSVQQIVHNLLINAIGLAGAGTQVIVSTAIAPSGQVVVRVRYAGAAARKKDAQTAPEPAPPPRAQPATPGRALGLALVKGLAEANNATFTEAHDGTLVEIAFSPAGAAGPQHQ